jgi:hypothetical protein
MAAITDAMQWSGSPGEQLIRPKYLFDVTFYSKTNTALQDQAKMTVKALRTIELPRFSVETEVINAWNVRQLVPTKIQYDPISITFTDTTDNKFQTFLGTYLSEISNNFSSAQVETSMKASMRTSLDGFGLKVRPDMGDTVFEKIEIIKFYNDKTSVVTLWRPKIVDVQHDTLDYNASEAVTWTISLRYEAITYSTENPVAGSTPAGARDKRTQEQIDYSKSLGDFYG